MSTACTRVVQKEFGKIRRCTLLSVRPCAHPSRFARFLHSASSSPTGGSRFDSELGGSSPRRFVPVSDGNADVDAVSMGEGTEGGTPVRSEAVSSFARLFASDEDDEESTPHLRLWPDESDTGEKRDALASSASCCFHPIRDVAALRR
jgi:hypothetical protein